MTTIATLAIKLIGDISGFTASMSEAEDTAKSVTGSISEKFVSMGTKLAAVGAGMTAAITTPLVLAAKTAISYASDLEETKNKASVVFGDMAQDVLDWSATSAQAMGQSQNQALAAASTYGNLFVTMGLGQEPAAQMSMSLVQLASDLASFNNADPSEVLAAMQSGLVGQVEPLRKYGVVLSEAAVAAKAAELGLGGLDGELTEAEKLQARYAIILEQTTTAQGDFARTSEGLANKTRIVKAQLADAGAKIGSMLLPYVLKAANFVSTLVEKFTNLSPATQKVILIIAGVAAVIGPLLTIIGTLITAIGAIIPVVTAVAGAISFPLIAIIAAVIGVVALLVAAWKNNWGGIRDKLMEVWDKLKPIFQAIRDWLAVNIPLAIQAVKDWWTNTLLPALQTFWDWVVANLFPIFQTIYDWFINYLAFVIAYYSALWTTVLLPALQAVWEFISGTLWPMIVQFGSFLGSVFSIIIATLSDLWQNVFLPVLNAVWIFISGTLWPLFVAVADFLGAVFGLVLTTLAAIWVNVLLPALTIVWDFITNSLWPLIVAVVDFLSAVFSVALTALAGIWENVLLPALTVVYNWIKDQLQPVWEALSTFIDETVMPIIEAFGNWLSNSLAPAFEGISNAISAVIDWLEGLADAVRNIELPDWMTPGSPTPWEIGLVGIDKSMERLARTRLPQLQTSLQMLPEDVPYSGMQFAGQGGGISIASMPISIQVQQMSSEADMAYLAEVLVERIKEKARQ